MENISGKYEKYLRKDPPEGMGQWATILAGAASPPAMPGKLVGPTWLRRPQFQRYKFTFVPEKIKREEFIAFHDPEAPPHPVLALEGRSGVRFGLRIKEIVAIVIINLPPSPIP